jgi:hypothetical protein
MTGKIKPETYILLGIPALPLAATLFHFIYSLTGKLFIVGLFAPVNESVFEHMKMVTLPILLWWSLFYLFRKNSLNADVWFGAALSTMVVAVITIPLLYYFYTGAFGTESVVVDIIILFIAVALGQLMGLHFYRYRSGINAGIAFIIMLAIIIVFAVLTIIPPELPFFEDSKTGSYGM